MRKSFLRVTKEVLILLLAGVGYAVGVAVFLEPRGLAAGGVSGLAIVLNHLTGLNTGLIIFVINVPLIILGIYKFGLRFLLSTVFVIAVSSAAITFLSRLPDLPLDMRCSSVCGAVLVGGSIGVLFRMGATTGGSDIIVRLLRLKFRHVRTGGIFLALDAIVIALAGLAFRNAEICIYAVICVAIEAYMINLVLYGLRAPQLVCVFSGRAGEIAAALLDSGLEITPLRADGSTAVMLVRKRDVPDMRVLISLVDESAAVTISALGGVYGGGFALLCSDDG